MLKSTTVVKEVSSERTSAAVLKSTLQPLLYFPVEFHVVRNSFAAIEETRRFEYDLIVTQREFDGDGFGVAELDHILFSLDGSVPPLAWLCGDKKYREHEHMNYSLSTAIATETYSSKSDNSVSEDKERPIKKRKLSNYKRKEQMSKKQLKEYPTIHEGLGRERFLADLCELARRLYSATDSEDCVSQRKPLSKSNQTLQDNDRPQLTTVVQEAGILLAEVGHPDFCSNIFGCVDSNSGHESHCSTILPALKSSKDATARAYQRISQPVNRNKQNPARTGGVAPAAIEVDATDSSASLGQDDEEYILKADTEWSSLDSTDLEIMPQLVAAANGEEENLNLYTQTYTPNDWEQCVHDLERYV